MVESGKPKSSAPKSTQKISVSSEVSEADKYNKDNVSFDEVLDDLKSLDDIKETPASPLNKRIALKNSGGNIPKASGSSAPRALETAPPLNKRPGSSEPGDSEDIDDEKPSITTKPTTPVKPRIIRTTDGMVAGTVRRNNLAPITKRPLGVPMEQRNTQVVTAPKLRPADEDEDESTTNPLLAAFWTKKRLIIAGAIVVTLAVVAGLTFLIINKSSSQPTVDDEVEEEVIKQDTTVNYDHKMTNAEGGAPDTTHQLESDKDLSVLFTDLTCEDQNCSNVSSVKIGSSVLTRGADYVAALQDGHLLFTIKASKLNSLKVGNYALTFELTEGSKISRIGLKFSITESEKDDDDEDEEPATNSGSNSGSTSRPSTSTTNTKPSTGSNTGNTGNTGNSSSSGNTGNTGGNTSTTTPGGSTSTGGETTGGNTGTGENEGNNTGSNTGEGGNTGTGEGQTGTGGGIEGGDGPIEKFE